MIQAQPLLSVEHLSKRFNVRRGTVHALSDVSFSVARGEVLGVVGESGSGKTTIGRTLLRLEESSEGCVMFDGRDLTAMRGSELRRNRWRLQYIFQNPFSSLSPRMTIGEILTEGMALQKIGNRSDRESRARAALRDVELPEDAYEKYAHEFSGGQRQRIGIARAIAMQPEFIVADEPVSALDVSVQAQIINLLRGLQMRLNLTMLFITHDLGVVEYVCDRVMVLYLGRIMEIAPSDKLYSEPAHPYTRALLDAIPSAELDAERPRTYLSGEIPSPISPPSGCVFRTRCPHAISACATTVPELRTVGEGHMRACLRDDIAGTPIDTREPVETV